MTKIGKDDASGSMRYRVEITGPDQRTFEVRVPLTAVASKAAWEEEIKNLFAHGWMPDDGAVHTVARLGW